jgi:flagellar biosynthesis GTPase FlhF
MKCENGHHKRYFNSRLYERLRTERAKYLSETTKGRDNSQYGTCWIFHDLIGNKKIKKTKFPEYHEQGWILRTTKTKERKILERKNGCEERRRKNRERMRRQRERMRNQSEWKMKQQERMWKKQERMREKEEKKQEKIRKKQERKQYVNDIFIKYLKSDCDSMLEFCKKGYYDKSCENLSYLFRQHVDGYIDVSYRGGKKNKDLFREKYLGIPIPQKGNTCIECNNLHK